MVANSITISFVCEFTSHWSAKALDTVEVERFSALAIVLSVT
jgi:hypothetical protein